MNSDSDTTNDAGNELSNEASAPIVAPQWKPLTAKQRRILGTLMEKSKTTPDAYPMTFAGLTTGANQKTNRAPLSNYSSEQVESIVDELRALGAVTIVQGVGRVTKVRHYAYNWLAINKTEAAIMTELLLRGEQTIGELRTRASRMEPINDLAQLSELIQELKRRNLVVELSPPGRGQLLSHNLYPEWELDQLRKLVTSGTAHTAEDSTDSQPTDSPSTVVVGHSDRGDGRIAALEEELRVVKESLATTQARLSHIEKELGLA